MIDIDDMAEICKKCTNYHLPEDSQDDEGCILKRPLANCPHLRNIYKLPDAWRNSKKDWGIGWFEDCATELEKEIKRK